VNVAVYTNEVEKEPSDCLVSNQTDVSSWKSLVITTLFEEKLGIPAVLVLAVQPTPPLKLMLAANADFGYKAKQRTIAPKAANVGLFRILASHILV
jgi:hypothetical protein